MKAISAGPTPSFLVGLAYLVEEREPGVGIVEHADHWRLVSDEELDGLRITSRQVEPDDRPAATPEHHRGALAVVLEHREGIVALMLDPKPRRSASQRTPRIAAAVVGQGRVLVREALGHRGVVACVTATTRDEQQRRSAPATLKVEIST
jgi:hypothetical protein